MTDYGAVDATINVDAAGTGETPGTSLLPYFVIGGVGIAAVVIGLIAYGRR